MRIRNIVLALIVIVLVFIGLVLTGVLGPHTVNTPESQQLRTSDADIPKGMSRGEYIARTADCSACHTTDKNKPYAGGLAMPLPMGTLYTTNITPDKEHGIGDYSLADFKRVLREGIRKDGSHLYPAMPYTAYTKMSDSDIKSLYDYFMNEVKPVNQPNKAADVPAILGMRWPLAFWNWIFFDKGAYAIRDDKDDEWNRGAYLVQGPAHCGTCHTPRGIGMQEVGMDDRSKDYLSGADLAGWHAFNITGDKVSGVGNWSKEQIVDYLKTGSVAGKAQAAGPMAEAVEHSFQYMSDRDLESIATYLKSIPGKGDSGSVSRFDQGKAVAVDIPLRGLPLDKAREKDAGAQLYLGNCATCHDVDGSGSPDGYYPSMYHNSVVGTDNITNLVQVILKGVKRHAAGEDILMPAFENKLSDDEIATLVNFLTRTYGQGDAKISSDQVRAIAAGKQ